MSEQAELQVISGRLERGEVSSRQFLEQLMRFVAAQIGCSRAGLRVLIPNGQNRVLHCVAMYDRLQDRMVSADDIVHDGRSLYLERLQRDGNVIAAQALDDPVAVGSLREYLQATHVVSLMDMNFSVNGVSFGTFTCEQFGSPIDWTQRQVQVLRKIAARASLTLVHVVTTSIDTTPGALWESSVPNRLATMPAPLDLLPE